MSRTEFNPVAWKKVQIFCKSWPPMAQRDVVTSIQKGVKRVSQEQNQQAPRRTGKMASETVYLNETSGGAAVSKMFYSVFVDQGTYRMPARPFFTDPMKKSIPVITQEVNTAFALSIKKFFV